jgi:hypothetical protein
MEFPRKAGEQINMIGKFLVIGSTAIGLIAGYTGALAQEPAKTNVVLKERGPVHYGRSGKIKATVEAIDLATRHLTVKVPKGYLMTMRVEERVRNLPEAKIGDEVTLRYNEAVGLEIRVMVEDEAAPEEGGEEAAPATEPDEEMVAAEGQRIVSAVVETVAVKQKTLMIKDETGNFTSIYIRDAEVLEMLEAGQKVLVRHKEAAVVSIELPKPEVPKPKKKKR